MNSSCIVPMSLMEKREWAAYTIRPKIKKLLPKFLAPAPTIHVKRKFDQTLPDLHTEVTAGNIAELTGAKLTIASVGPGREQTIFL